MSQDAIPTAFFDLKAGPQFPDIGRDFLHRGSGLVSSATNLRCVDA
jgi:hypothetical protein